MPELIKNTHHDNLSLMAPAKINLFLHITGRRDNGFHEIESLFVRTDIGDKISMSLGDSLSLEVIGPFSTALSSGDPVDNLVMRAAKSLSQFCGLDAGASIVLEKHLPIASGVGGGSADAAATLLGLRELWQLSITNEEMIAIALDLGADVPACLSTHPQWVTGVGEICDEVKLGDATAILLVNPGVDVATDEIFRFYKSSGVGFTEIVRNQPEILKSVEVLRSSTFNDLYEPSKVIAPIIEDVINEMLLLPRQQLVRMSGSGATCFALFHTHDEAIAALRQIKINKPEWWVASGHILA